MKCAIYCRVSTEEQALHGISIDAQLDELRNYAKEHNYTIYNEYIDAGYSGGLLHRPALDKLLIDASNKCFQVVLFVKLDRWFRSVPHYYKIQEILENNNINWIATQEDYETLTSSGQFKVNIMLSVSQQFKQATSERIKSVFDYKLKVSNEVRSGSVPYGYCIKDKKYIIDEDKAKNIVNLYKKFDACKNIKETTIWWNNNFNTTTNYKTIRKRLTDKRYIGIYTHNNIEYTNYYPPILDNDLFYSVYSAITNKITNHQKTKRIYLFSSLVYCGECGSKCCSKSSKHYKYYWCQNIKSGLCSYYTLNENKLENEVLNQLPMKAKYSLKNINESDTHEKDNTKLIKSKQNRLKELYIDGLINKNEFNTKYNELESQIIKTEKKEKVDYSILLNGTYYDLYQKLDDKHKNLFFKGFIDKIILNKDGSIEVIIK